jgi:hypothetical protein
MDAALSGAGALQVFKRMRAAAVKIQAVWRGVLAKKRVAFLRYTEAQDWLHSRATLIACVWRAHRQRGRFQVLVAAKVARDTATRQAAAATQIQKYCRAHLTRVKYLAQLRVRHLDPRLRRHAEKRVAKGDIWTVLERVDLDFRFIDREYKEEKDNVKVFIKDVLEKRENDMRFLTLDFRHAVETNENAQAVSSMPWASRRRWPWLSLDGVRAVSTSASAHGGMQVPTVMTCLWDCDALVLPLGGRPAPCVPRRTSHLPPALS